MTMRLFLSFKILFLIILIIFMAVSLWMKYQLLIITPLNIDKYGYNYSVKAGTNLGKVRKELSLLFYN